jgi:hypothetical protein
MSSNHHQQQHSTVKETQKIFRMISGLWAVEKKRKINKQEREEG